MKYSEKSKAIYEANKLLFDVNFHDFMEKECHSSMYELANEFGLSFNDVLKLKKQLNNRV